MKYTTPVDDMIGRDVLAFSALNFADLKEML